MAGYSPWGSKELDMGWDKYKGSKMSKLMKHHTPQPQLLKNALSCSFQNKKNCCCLVTKSCPTLCNPWTVAHQAPLSMGFSRQEYWSRLSFPPPGDLPHPGIEPNSPVSLALQRIVYHWSHWWSPVCSNRCWCLHIFRLVGKDPFFC